ncbi:PIN domain-containing protein [Corynebacterium sp. zg912]|uniref:Ribonuclease VapC n=1 Tax=Corynebacterium wankanglinii TaxID=2735136 RepID=A0A7H0KAQ1_9CORY|nr:MULTISPECIES: type II toxin-antitoxin system VapC family toxin [Corynebacterium]MBA1836672.1 type II toxin-antitoxin system VapC family toxin [Corynebacterium wankanglinii]MCR5929506.1 PIN domain-containing protein [Corynebacterium sp. zg912]QNP94367.1 type II toxin-antitoxin system VapC family toxin [Corynebacterium wankanglinii]
MRYILDTNVWIDALRRSNAEVLAHMRIAPADDIAMSSIVLGELKVGAGKSPSNDRAKVVKQLEQAYRLVGVGAAEAAHYADIRTTLESAGQPIGPNDLWIAAQARANNCVLVTANTREFSRVPLLQVEDWRG